jgi:hypothetical protein
MRDASTFAEYAYTAAGAHYPTLDPIVDILRLVGTHVAYGQARIVFVARTATGKAS